MYLGEGTIEGCKLAEMGGIEDEVDDDGTFNSLGCEVKGNALKDEGLIMTSSCCTVEVEG